MSQHHKIVLPKIQKVLNNKNQQQLKMQANIQIPTRENSGIGTVQLYEQYEKHITACLQAKHKLQMESMLLDHDNQKFNLQAEKMELIYQKCQLEKKCQLLQNRLDLQMMMKNDFQMKSKYQKEEIDELYKSNQLIKGINAKLDDKIRQIQEENQKVIEELNKTSEKSLQDMSDKMKIVKNQLKETSEKLEEKIKSLQEDKNGLSEQVNQLKQQLYQSYAMNEKLKNSVMTSCVRLIDQKEQSINQFNILNRVEDYIQKTWIERDSISKLIQNNQKGKQVKDAPLVLRIQSIIQTANRQKTKIETGWNQFENKLNNLMKMFVKDYTEQHGHQLLEALETKIVQFDSEISEKSSLLQSMTKQAKQVGRQLKKIPEYEKKIKQLQQLLANKSSQIQEYKQVNVKAMSKIEMEQKTTINNANKQRQNLQQRVEQLQGQIKTQEQQIQEQRKQLEKRSEQVKQAHRQKQERLGESMQKRTGLEEEYKKLEKECKIMQQSIRRYKQENRKQTEQLIQRQQSNNTTLKELEKANKQISVLKNKMQQAKNKQNAQLLKNSQNNINNINNINKELKELRNRNEELDQQVNRLNKDIRNKQMDIKQKQQWIQQGFRLQKEVCHLAATYCTANANYKVTDFAEALKMIEANLAMNKINKSQNIISFFLTIPTLSKKLADDLEWVKPFICKDYENKKITSNYLRTQKNEIDFTQYVGKTNIVMLIQTDSNAVFMLMMRRIAKSEEKKLGNDTVFIVTKDKKRYPPQGNSAAFPCVNKNGVLVLGKDEMLITKKLKVQIDFKEDGYFGEVDVQSMLNITDLQKKDFKINQVQIYEILQK